MPLPRSIARVNRRVTNRLLGGLAQRLPGFGVVVHKGRTSGRQYRTPVNVFRRGDRYIIALTYGPNADWVRNVLADGGCTLETRGRTSGPEYRTPVNIFRRADRFVIALTYGSNADWVRNVIAHDGCALETRGRTLRLSRPQLFHDESRHAVPSPVRLVLGLVKVSDFLKLTMANEGSTHDSEVA